MCVRYYSVPPETSRSGWFFSTALAVIAFSLNWLWENAQTPLYVEMASRPWWQTVQICTLATVGDVAITFAVCGVGALAAGDVRWGMTGRWNVYALGALLGAATAVGVEWQALASGWWSYTDGMPVVPLFTVGLSPFLQLSLLVPIALWIARWWAMRKQVPERRHYATEMTVGV